MRAHFRTAMQGYQDVSPAMGVYEAIPNGLPSMEILVETSEGTALLTLDLTSEEAKILHNLAGRAAQRYFESARDTGERK